MSWRKTNEKEKSTKFYGSGEDGANGLSSKMKQILRL